MACTVKVNAEGLTSTPFGSGAPGGRVFGSVRLTAVCEEEQQPELEFDEDDTGLVAWLVELLNGPKLYNRPKVTDLAGREAGFVVIESAYRIDRSTIGVQLNVTTNAKGRQTFKLSYMCRCKPDENWTKGAVTVTFSMP